MGQIPHGIRRLKATNEITKWVGVRRHSAGIYRRTDNVFGVAIVRQASRNSLEYIDQDPFVMEGHREQVQSSNEVWQLP